MLANLLKYAALRNETEELISTHFHKKFKVSKLKTRSDSEIDITQHDSVIEELTHLNTSQPILNEKIRESFKLINQLEPKS